MNTRRKAPRRLLRRSPTTIDQAVDLVSRHTELAGSSALFLCTRVGEADFVPPRYRINQCSECDAPVWISGDLVEATERRGMVVVSVCFTCLEPAEGG